MSSPFPKALVLLLLLGFCGITAWATRHSRLRREDAEAGR
jgi:hypothetical protein